jgi:predicted nucleic acid-binding protein
MIVSNSSCLIVLEKLGKLDILQKLYGKIIIPHAVVHEVFRSKSKPPWIEAVKVKQPIASMILEKSLGDGESEAIALSLELKSELLIIDDLAARKLATELNLRYTGVVGILLQAKEHKLISEVRTYLDQMLKHDFRISRTVYDEALELAGESGGKRKRTRNTKYLP